MDKLNEQVQGGLVGTNPGEAQHINTGIDVALPKYTLFVEKLKEENIFVFPSVRFHIHPHIYIHLFKL